MGELPFRVAEASRGSSPIYFTSGTGNDSRATNDPFNPPDPSIRFPFPR